MAGKNTAVFGIYSNRGTAETAVNQFLTSGFSNDDVSVLMSDVIIQSRHTQYNHF